MPPFTVVASDSSKLLAAESSLPRVELPAGSALNITDDSPIYVPPKFFPALEMPWDPDTEPTVPEEVIQSLAEDEPLVVQFSGVGHTIDTRKLARLAEQAARHEKPTIVLLKD
jgi:hypothetical protein